MFTNRLKIQVLDFQFCQELHLDRLKETEGDPVDGQRLKCHSLKGDKSWPEAVVTYSQWQKLTAWELKFQEF